MDLDMNYSYDLNEDWVPTSKTQLRALWIFGIVNFFLGSVFMLDYIQDDAPNIRTLIAAIGGLAGGISMTIFYLLKYKAILAKGVYYLRVKNGLLQSKLGRYTKIKQVEVAKIKRASINERFMILHMQNGDQIHIKTSNIMNLDKKEEFEQIIRSEIPHH